ncbi:rhomboid family intramembrane serine protease [Haloferula sp. BvORR071]|uniref:rhomboid family intramembrane serine protease n=1 Tax=Haloferula sp. BvORR071 TaxID=1396141 RepID=UPI0009467139|nr:rhomboid family intramembrane serine protease [Haloferula sp. BvORR071]
MFFPISDDNREVMGTAYVSIALLLANVALFIVQLMHPAFTYGWSVIPYEITHGTDLVGVAHINAGGAIHDVPQVAGPSPIYLTIFSAMFMHGGWMHIGGNMLYLWIFGDNVEHRFGSLKFLIFYLVSGIVATFAQIAVNPQSVIPNLGASGAIAGVLGAYLVLFPRNRVNAVFFFTIVSVPAVFVIGMWAFTQFASGFGSIATTDQTTGGVAYMAHIGGFLAGVAMALYARKRMKNHEPPSVFRRIYEEQPRVRRYW